MKFDLKIQQAHVSLIFFNVNLVDHSHHEMRYLI